MGQVLLILGLMALAGCSSETEDSSSVNQDRVYQLYSVDYDGDKAEFKRTASFTLGGPSGTTLELVSGSAVTVNDQSMEKLTTSVSGTFYIRQEKGDFSNRPQEFRWKDASGKLFNNAIALNMVKFPENLSVSFSKAAGITVAWTGDAVLCCPGSIDTLGGS